MRVGSTLYYVLKDHLGSASVVTDSTGTIVGEDRFYPFGETRLTTGTMQTDKLFTGQREITGLGIYYYGARFYSPKLGRFISPDSIIPGYTNPQNLNRYSYTLNNPIRYVDPTGHVSCSGSNWDDGPSCFTDSKMDSNLKGFGVTTSGMSHKHKLAILQAVHDVGNKLLSRIGGSAESAFRKVFKKGVNFTWGGEGATSMCASVTSGGCTSGANANQINFWSMSRDMVKNVVHELGHAFYHAVGDPLLGNSFSRDALIRNASYASGEVLVWEQHPISMNKDNKEIATELFADTFIAWTYDTWNPDNPKAAGRAQEAMNAFP